MDRGLGDASLLQRVDDLGQLVLGDHQVAHRRRAAVAIAGEGRVGAEREPWLDLHALRGDLQVTAGEPDPVDRAAHHLAFTAQRVRHALPVLRGGGDRLRRVAGGGGLRTGTPAAALAGPGALPAAAGTRADQQHRCGRGREPHACRVHLSYRVHISTLPRSRLGVSRNHGYPNGPGSPVGPPTDPDGRRSDPGPSSPAAGQRPARLAPVLLRTQPFRGHAMDPVLPYRSARQRRTWFAISLQTFEGPRADSKGRDQISSRPLRQYRRAVRGARIVRGCGARTISAGTAARPRSSRSRVRRASGWSGRAAAGAAGPR